MKDAHMHAVNPVVPNAKYALEVGGGLVEKDLWFCFIKHSKECGELILQYGGIHLCFLWVVLNCGSYAFW